MKKESKEDREGRLAVVEHRKRNFAIKVEPSESPEWGTDLVLRISDNGNQWSSQGLSIDEATRVVGALTDYLKTL